MFQRLAMSGQQHKPYVLTQLVAPGAYVHIFQAIYAIQKALQDIQIGTLPRRHVAGAWPEAERQTFEPRYFAY